MGVPKLIHTEILYARGAQKLIQAKLRELAKFMRYPGFVLETMNT